MQYSSLCLMALKHHEESSTDAALPLYNVMGVRSKAESLHQQYFLCLTNMVMASRPTHLLLAVNKRLLANKHLLALVGSSTQSLTRC